MSAEFDTLPGALRWWASRRPQQTAVTFLLDGDQETSSLTYGELDRQARAIAVALQNMGLTGERALLLLPPGLDFIAALFGCLYAGVVVVPTYPPRLGLRSRSAARLAKLAQDANARLAITTESSLSKVALSCSRDAGLDGLRWWASDIADLDAGDAWTAPEIAAGTAALIQYTSGSTSSPRGVVLSHRNLMNNLEIIATRWQHSAGSCCVTWLPPYHDMGLITGILQPIVYGFPVLLMSPLQMLQRPLRWLQAISRYRATTSGGPDFTYDMCARLITPSEKARLDLSSWRVAFNGSEPIRPDTLERFCQAFKPCGFRPEAFYPCYGLAESTLYVSGGATGGSRILSFDRAALAQRRAVMVSADMPDSRLTRRLVSCGTTAGDHRIVITDPESCLPLERDQIGEIWLCGPSVAEGYWNRPEETRDTFGNYLPGEGGPFLRTGDLGFLVGGELFITGRMKDLVIIRGRNYHPHDIEDCAANSHPALMLNGSAAFSVDKEGSEQLVVACEVRREDRRHLKTGEVIQAIRRAVAEEFELLVRSVLLLRPGSIPRTTSGKIQRNSCREAFLHGTWEPIAEDTIERAPASDQVSRLELREAIVAALGPSREDERVALLHTYLAQRLSTLLNVRLSSEDLGKSLGYVGVDSMTGVELILTIEADLGVEIAPETLGPEMLLSELSTLIDRRLAETARSPQRHPSTVSSADRDSSLDERYSDTFVRTGQRIPLTPLQHEFLRPGVEHPERFSTIVYLRTPASVNATALESALRSQEHQHDALRLRFSKDGDRWEQKYADLGTAIGFDRIPMTGVPPDQVQAIKRMLNEDLPGDFDLAHGPLIRAVWLDRGSDTGLLIVNFHHLVMDGLSIAVFLDGLLRSYLQRPDLRCRGGEDRAPHESHRTFGGWAAELEEFAQSRAVRRDFPYWLETCRDGSAASSVDLAADHDVENSAEWAQVPAGRLDPGDNRRFLERFPTSQQRHDAVLAGLVRAWKSLTGEERFFVRLESHGRHPLVGRAPSTTVGWFVNQFPLRLEVKSSWDDTTLLDEVQSAVRRTPHQGVSYGLLTHLCRDPRTRSAMHELPTPRLGMVYRSGIDDTFRADAMFPVLGVRHHARARRHDNRSPNLVLSAGKGQGAIFWTVGYKPAAYSAATISALQKGVEQFLRNVSAFRST